MMNWKPVIKGYQFGGAPDFSAMQHKAGTAAAIAANQALAANPDAAADIGGSGMGFADLAKKVGVVAATRALRGEPEPQIEQPKPNQPPLTDYQNQPQRADSLINQSKPLDTWRNNVISGGTGASIQDQSALANSLRTGTPIKPLDSTQKLQPPTLPQLVRGGTIDYRRGGTIAGGPPGIDTVPVVAQVGGPTKAMMNNGEYALPGRTVNAVGGKPVLDELVVATTGKKPVGYGQVPGYGFGGLIDKLRNRGKQTDDAVEQAVAPSPPPEIPKEPNMADIMREIRRKHPPMGQKPQGYGDGGMTELERKRMQAIDPRFAVATGWQPEIVQGSPAELLDSRTAVARAAPVPMQFAPPMAGGNLIAAPAVPGAAIPVTAADRVPDYNDADLALSKRIGQPSPSDVRSQEMWSNVAAAPTPGLKAHELISGVRGQLSGAAVEMAEGARDIAAPIIKPAYNFATELVTGKPASADVISGNSVAVPVAVASPGAVAVPSPDQASLTKNGAMIRVTDPAMQKEFGNAVLTNQSEADTWKGLAGGKKGFLGVVGGAPQGVSDADYAKMSLPEKSAAKVKSINEATAAIRSVPNAQREANGLPPVGWGQGLAGLKPSEQIAYANLMRGIDQDEIKNQFELADLKIKGAGEKRQQTKAQQEAQDRYMERATPYIQNAPVDLPGIGDATSYFQQAADIGKYTPEQAYGTLSQVRKMMEDSTETKPLFTYKNTPITEANAIKILNGEYVFDEWLGFKGPSKEEYAAMQKMAAQALQEYALTALRSK